MSVLKRPSEYLIFGMFQSPVSKNRTIMYVTWRLKSAAGRLFYQQLVIPNMMKFYFKPPHIRLFVKGIEVNYLKWGPVMRKAFPRHDVILFHTYRNLSVHTAARGPQLPARAWGACAPTGTVCPCGQDWWGVWPWTPCFTGTEINGIRNLYFRSRKGSWKCRLQKGGHFISTVIYVYLAH